MATTFKTFLNNDITSTKTLLHEAIPLTGTIVSGAYGANTINIGNEPNIKNYAHGMFQSVYDYGYLSSSANHIFDLTVGYSNNSKVSSSSGQVQRAKKINLYTQMAQTMVGYDSLGNIRDFDEDGNLAGGVKSREGFFINFARLLNKDEIKKGSFSLKLGVGDYTGGADAPFNNILTISDAGKENNYRVNSPAGEYAILSATAGYNSEFPAAPACGLIFYQAGVAFISSSVFMSGTYNSATSNNGGLLTASCNFQDPDLIGPYEGLTYKAALTGSSISSSCNFIRHRVQDLTFNNTTELNSTIHFCRINHNEFNYSANPTYLSDGKITVKNNTLDTPISYFTTIGLYSSDNELLAVAKLSEPLKKDPTNEMTIRVRLDY